MRRESDATEPGRGGRRRGRPEAGEVSQEETGWLDDLRGAAGDDDDLGGRGFTDSGTGRWAKLSALNDDPPAADRPARGGRAPDPASSAPAREGEARRRRTEPEAATGRRAARDAEPVEGGRRRGAPPAADRPGGDPDTSRRRGAPDRADAAAAGRRRAGAETPESQPDADTSGRRRAGLDLPDSRADADTSGRRRSGLDLPDGRADADTSGRRRSGLDLPDSDTAGRRAGGEEPAAGRRRAADDRGVAEELIGRRAAADGPDPEVGRRAAPSAEPGRRGTGDAARRAADPGLSFNRRAAEDPVAGRRAAEESAAGRRAAEEPPTGRRREPEAPSRPGGATLGAPPVGPRTGNAPQVDAARAGRSPAGGPPAGGPGPAISGASPGGPARGSGPSAGDSPSAAGPGMPPKSQPGPGLPGMAAAPAMPSTAPPGSMPSGGSLPGGGMPPAGRGPAGPPPSTQGKIRPVSGAPLSATPMSPGVPQRPGAGPVPRGGPGDLGRPGDPVRGAARPEPADGIDGEPANRGLAAGVDAIRGARSEVRRQLREQQRVRMWTLIAIVVMVIGALPFYLVLRSATSDPVFRALDSLGVPEWAAVAGTTQDNSNGSRWCLLDCRYRERTVESQKETDETFAQYETALGESGWTRWEAPLCPPDNVEGSYSCWKRDEFVLDLYVRPSECAKNPLYQRPTAGTGEATVPQATAAATEAAGAPPVEVCNPSVVSLKVFNAIADPHVGDPNASPGAGIEDGLTDDDVTGDMTPEPGPSGTQSAG